MLDTLFMDGLYSDLERLTQINQLLDSVPDSQKTGSMQRMRPIDTMLIVPSQDLREIAYRHRKAMPTAIRALLRGVGGKDPAENRLLSFLLFESAYTTELIELGYQDAQKVKEQLYAFAMGEDVPRLYAPQWIKKDLSVLRKGY